MDFTVTYLDWSIFVGVLLILFYIWSTWTFDYFSKRNVPFLKPIPFFGNIYRSVILRKEHQVVEMNRTYYAFPNNRYVGIYDFRTPAFMIRDPELIKQIGIKDFDHFVDHQSFIEPDHDPLFGNNLFALKGQRWRDMRATLSPAFTGSKMKQMYSLVSESSKQMVDYLSQRSTSGSMVFDMKDLFTRYTNDVIATCAFGIKVDSLGQPENEFYMMGKSISDFSSFKSFLKFFGFGLVPKLMKLLDIRLFDNRTSSFFRHLVIDTMNTRERENIIRPDMINLLIQARKGTLKHEAQVDNVDAGFATVEESSVGKESHKTVWTDDDLAAQAILFFLAGFDTTSSLLCFTAHELAVNPDIQKTLLAEIDKAKIHGFPTYESMHKLVYLDMVISEALRKWPPGTGVSDRFCSQTYTVVDDDGSPDLEIDKGKTVMFPIFAIHRDPQYYPEPKRFDPDRFSEERKKDILPCTYIPFGVGPRNCIGSRFALMETKAVLFQILSEFTFEVCSKTSIPLELCKKSFLITPANGFWLELKPRKDTAA